MISEAHIPELENIFLNQNIEGLINFFEYDFNINTQDNYGDTILHIACKNDMINFIKILVAHPLIDVNLRNNKGESPLHCIKDKKVLKVFLKNINVDLNIRDNIEMSYLHKLNDIKLIKYLIKHTTIDINIINGKGESPLFTDNIDKYKLLARQFKANINHQDNEGRTLLMKTNNIELIKELVNNPFIDVNKSDNNGNCPFYYANIVKSNLLIQNKCFNVNFINNDGDSLLHCINDSEKLRLLLNHPKIIVNIKNFEGMPPFLIGSVNKCKMILEHEDCNPNFMNDATEAPLHYIRDVQLYKLLLSHPLIDVNIQTDTGDSPLHKLIDNVKQNDNMELIQMLLDHPDINVNLIDCNGNTPLHICINDMYAEALMKHPNIDLTIENFNDETALVA